MPRPPRDVELGWARARSDRVPIRNEGRVALDFGERVIGRRDDERIDGIVGWDPSLGWVLILEPKDRR